MGRSQLFSFLVFLLQLRSKNHIIQVFDDWIWNVDQTYCFTKMPEPLTDMASVLWSVKRLCFASVMGAPDESASELAESKHICNVKKHLQ